MSFLPAFVRGGSAALASICVYLSSEDRAKSIRRSNDASAARGSAPLYLSDKGRFTTRKPTTDKPLVRCWNVPTSDGGTRPLYADSDCTRATNEFVKANLRHAAVASSRFFGKETPYQHAQVVTTDRGIVTFEQYVREGGKPETLEPCGFGPRTFYQGFFASDGASCSMHLPEFQETLYRLTRQMVDKAEAGEDPNPYL